MSDHRMVLNELQFKISRGNSGQFPKFFREMTLGPEAVPVGYLVDGQLKVFQVFFGMGEPHFDQVIMHRCAGKIREYLPKELPVEAYLFDEAIKRNVFRIMFVDVVDSLPHLRGFKRSDVTSNRHR